MSKEGTRATKSTDELQTFRKGAFKAFLKAGIPINKLIGLRQWIERECKQNLGSPTNAAALHVKELVNEETALQEHELKVIKHISIVFDATPR